ncbi:MAG: hypothetical protein JST26_20665 [Bacteroidetes bacterium]|nr:hypothetical protein [Bacteroidota bacterium]
MMRKFLLPMMFLCTLVTAQKQVEVKLSLRDGNTISGTTQLSDMVLKTDYGQLNIPIQNVNSIQIGIGSDKMTTEKAIPYLKILNGSGTDDIKKGAYADLIKLGVKAIPAIEDFMNDPKYSTETEPTGEYTPANAMAELRSAYNIDANTPAQDMVTIDNLYNMGGAYDFQKLDVKTEYGNLSIPKDKIKTIDITYLSPLGNNEVVVKLMASKNISSNQNGGWFKTGITLKQGQRFTITASGEVTLASLSNQKYKPDGSYIATNGTSYPATVTDEYSTAGTYPTYGNVVYKIGETSVDNLRAGAKFTGTATTGGMLYLAIYETVYNSANSGSYTVKISLK